MQIQLSWVRREFPRTVKPLAKGTNTLVFEDPDPTRVIVFLMCQAKRDWWVHSGLVTNPDEKHHFASHTVRGWSREGSSLHTINLYRVQAKKLFKPANGSPQKKEITATVKAMEKIYNDIRFDLRSSFTETAKAAHRRWSTEFWNRLWVTDLPTVDLAGFATDYYVLPDLAVRNALVDADGQIVWSDLFCSEEVLAYIHARSKPLDGRY